MRQFFILGLCLFTIVTFQNCADGFKIQPESLSELASQSSPLPNDNSIPDEVPPIVADPSTQYRPSSGPTIKGTQIVKVTNSTQFLEALSNAKAGDEITMADGVYNVNVDKIRINKAGNPDQYIFVRSENPMRAVIRLCSTSGDGFYVANAAYWVFENLIIENACEDQTDHAFHIVGGTTRFILRSNLITNFRSHVKVNGEGTPRLYPSHLWFLNNTWQLTRDLTPKSVPHNVLNIDGGHHMIIRGNTFADQLHTGRSSSSIYVKMGTQDFIVEQNLIVCQKRLKGTGYSPRGIFSGDAGSDPNPLCENNDCFNQRGMYRNNIVMNCDGTGNVSGLQIRLEKTTKYTHNTIHSVKNNFMFDDRAPIDVSLYSNIMEKGLSFQGSTHPSQYLDNLEQGSAGTLQIWRNPKIADFTLKDGSLIRAKVPKRVDTPHDFCGNPRAEMTDLGAIDYSDTAKANICIRYIQSLYNSL